MENKKINIKSYNKVWKIENRIYAIYNIKFPVPVKPREIMYFVVINIIMFILNYIPIIKIIPPVLKHLLFPIMLTQFLLKKKLDGRKPQKYFIALICYLFTKNQTIERFRAVAEQKNIKLNWICSKGIAAERKNT